MDKINPVLLPDAVNVLGVKTTCLSMKATSQAIREYLGFFFPVRKKEQIPTTQRQVSSRGTSRVGKDTVMG